MVQLLQDVQQWIRRLVAPRFATMFGTARIYTQTNPGRPMRVLDVEGTMQSATYLDEGWCDVPFDYLELYDLIFEANTKARNLLMLGGGGYAYPKHVIAHHLDARIDVVEIDPAITVLARRYFMLDRLEQCFGALSSGRLALVEADALDYVDECVQNGKRYDAILNDCFMTAEGVASLATPAALAAIQKALVSSGIYLINVVTALEGEAAAPLMELVANLSRVFDYVGAIPCYRRPLDEPDNVMVFALQKHPHLDRAITLYYACDSLSSMS